MDRSGTTRMTEFPERWDTLPIRYVDLRPAPGEAGLPRENRTYGRFRPGTRITLARLPEALWCSSASKP